MRIGKLIGVLLATSLAAVPATAQKPDDRSSAGRVAGEIAREIVDAADAFGTVTDAVADSVGQVRYRGAERFAVNRCAAHVQRYGRMQVEQVAPHGRRSLRVYGTVAGGTTYHDGRGDARRAFHCTVRDDGRVRVRTRRLA